MFVRGAPKPLPPRVLTLEFWPTRTSWWLFGRSFRDRTRMEPLYASSKVNPVVHSFLSLFLCFFFRYIDRPCFFVCQILAQSLHYYRVSMGFPSSSLHVLHTKMASVHTQSYTKVSRNGMCRHASSHICFVHRRSDLFSHAGMAC